MSLTPFTHKPTGVHAIQFDGTVTGLLTIFSSLVPDPSGVQVTVNFGGDGRVGAVVFAGAHSLSFSPSDWVVVPDDGGPLFVLTNAAFTGDWQS